MIVSFAAGMMPLWTIRNVSPRNIVPRIIAIATRVWAAFFDSGGLKAGTPFEIASVPVITAEPVANARSSRTG